MMSLHSLVLAVEAEWEKLRTQKVVERLFLANVLILVLFVALYNQFTGADNAVGLEEYAAVWGVHLFFSKFVYIFILSGLVCTQFGNEFDWRILHQFFIRGLTSESMLASKFLVYGSLLVGQYLVLTIIFMLGFFLFSPESIPDTLGVIPWVEVTAVPLGILMAMNVSILAVSLRTSASRAMVANFLYYVVVELFLRGVVLLVVSSGSDSRWEFLAQYFPFQTYLAIGKDTAGLPVYYGLSLVYIGVFWLIGYAILRKKEYGLLNR